MAFATVRQTHHQAERGPGQQGCRLCTPPLREIWAPLIAAHPLVLGFHCERLRKPLVPLEGDRQTKTSGSLIPKCVPSLIAQKVTGPRQASSQESL